MEPWAFLVVAAAITAIPAMALTLLCRTQVERTEDRLLPHWAKARAMVSVAIGGAAAMAAMPAPEKQSEMASGARHPRPQPKRQKRIA
jgi:hypothetical protein